MRQFKLTLQFTTAQTQIPTTSVEFDLSNEDAFLYDETSIETNTDLITNQDALEYINKKRTFDIFTFNIKFSDAKYTEFLGHLNNVNLYPTIILKYSDEGKIWWSRDCLVSNFKRVEKAKNTRMVQLSLKPITPFYKPITFDLSSPKIINSHSKTFQNITAIIKSQSPGEVIIKHVWEYKNSNQTNYIILETTTQTTKTAIFISNKNYFFLPTSEIEILDDTTHNSQTVVFNPIFIGPGKNTYSILKNTSTTFDVSFSAGDYYDFI